MNLNDVLSLSCSNCQYMIDFIKSKSQSEFSRDCPYRDSVESVACLKHTKIQEYVKTLG